MAGRRRPNARADPRGVDRLPIGIQIVGNVLNNRTPIAFAELVQHEI
jgi:hypothetical protein